MDASPATNAAEGTPLIAPSTTEGIEAYLASGLVKGIAPAGNPSGPAVTSSRTIRRRVSCDSAEKASRARLVSISPQYFKNH